VAAREGLAHRSESGVIAVEGPQREEFLQGQLTQDVRGLAPGEARPAAGLTPKGKLLYFGNLVGERERILLLLAPDAVSRTLAHLAKYAAFQKTSVRDATPDYARIALFGRGAAEFSLPEGVVRLPPEGELAGEILAPVAMGPELLSRLRESGSTPISDATAEILRIEAGRPRLLVDADDSNVPDELHLQAAISTTKGCYVGQESVARLRTYGRLQRRLVGLRFPEESARAGDTFPDPSKPERALARVTSIAVSPRFGPIGLGIASRDAAEGATLRSLDTPGRTAVVTSLPFA